MTTSGSTSGTQSGDTVEIYRGYDQVHRTYPGTVVTIGNFDGVHVGHQQILRTALAEAGRIGGTAIAFTFKPHPQVALRPESAPALLTTYEERLELIAAAGIPVIIEQPFSREFSTTEPEQFFNEVLLKRLNARSIVVGYDFGFGRGRSGHLEGLRAWSERSGVALTVVQPFQADGEIASSSRVREHLGRGEVEQAAKLLGRPFFYRGVVVRGDGRGRKIGFPTANIRPGNKIALPHGVYATWSIADGRCYASVTNLGVRPTFQGGDSKSEFPAIIETHLLDQDLDLYGRTVEVRFMKRLRTERKFAGVEALKAQISLDCVEARRVLDA
jgi:riboflavin kinase/FMN adenylyltransferase